MRPLPRPFTHFAAYLFLLCHIDLSPCLTWKFVSFLQARMALATSMDALGSINCTKTCSEGHDCVHEKQPQRLLKLKVVSKLPNSRPTLSTFSYLASDSDAVLMERLRCHHEHLYTCSRWSTILGFVLVRKVTLGFATYLIGVSQVFLSSIDTPSPYTNLS